MLDKLNFNNKITLRTSFQMQENQTRRFPIIKQQLLLLDTNVRAQESGQSVPVCLLNASATGQLPFLDVADSVTINADRQGIRVAIFCYFGYVFTLPCKGKIYFLLFNNLILPSSLLCQFCQITFFTFSIVIQDDGRLFSFTNSSINRQHFSNHIPVLIIFNFIAQVLTIFCYVIYARIQLIIYIPVFIITIAHFILFLNFFMGYLTTRSTTHYGRTVTSHT